ncbi:MAG: geranylgeranylglyceryl/heptaprenylglyceryl phosphate synthase [Bacteroidales bacterium]|nr:geranylgeranylglyceryl/heptaprenylglyceryl phosphate synthase [Bacteroidales bacterium]
MDVYPKLLESIKQKKFALLIDPDKCGDDDITARIEGANQAGVDFIFVGGSLMTEKNLEKCLSIIRSNTTIPLILFPGNGSHIHPNADAVFFLSLISGRNADLLIGNHVHAAPLIRKMKLETIATGYILVESGRLTTAQYMSGSLPIPHDKPDVAMATAIAGEMLGLKAIYMDAGSGAQTPISEKMIKQVKANISVPLIIGGGIRDIDAAEKAARAGGDIIVVGNAIEEKPDLIKEFAEAIHHI